MKTNSQQSGAAAVRPRSSVWRIYSRRPLWALASALLRGRHAAHHNAAASRFVHRRIVEVRLSTGRTFPMSTSDGALALGHNGWHPSGDGRDHHSFGCNSMVTNAKTDTKPAHSWTGRQSLHYFRVVWTTGAYTHGVLHTAQGAALRTDYAAPPVRPPSVSPDCDPTARTRTRKWEAGEWRSAPTQSHGP